jgi:hypothetical protein
VKSPIIDRRASIKWLSAGLLLLLAIHLYQCAFHYFEWLKNPYPNEYREGAGLHATLLFSEGVNPFKEGAPPTFFYMYGFLYPLVASFFYKAVHTNGFLMLRLISISCLVVTSILVALRAKQMGSAIPSLLIALVILKTGWITHELVGRPDQLAMLLSTICYILLTGSEKIFATTVAAGLLVLTFYTKQYFFFLGLPMMIGTAFFSLQRALTFGFVAIFLLVVSLICVDLIYPHYFPMTLLSYGAQPLSLKHLFRQTGDFFSNFWPLVFLCVFPLIRSPFSLATRSNTNRLYDTNALSWERMDSPNHLKFWSAQLVGGILLLILIGVVPGAWRTYFNQFLLVPLVFIAAALSSSWRETRLFWLSLCTLVIVSLLQVGRSERSLYFTPPLTSAERKSWQEATDTALNCGEKIDIRSPLFVKTALENNLRFFQNGLQANEWLDLAYDGLKSRSPKIAQLFRHSETLLAAGKQYNEDRITAAQIGGGFVVCTDNVSIADEELLLHQGYQVFSQQTLRSGRQVWNVKFWRHGSGVDSAGAAL